MHKQTLNALFACVAAVVAASAAISASGAELTHRWSFNGNWSDSVGGADAVKRGSYVSLYGNRVHMGYGSCSHGSGYVDLGTNMLDTTAATIEIWARHDGVQNWSRIFDYGADNTHYFYAGWTYGTNLARERVEFYNSANADKTCADDSLGKYEIGVDYHVAVTFKNNGDGTTDIRWQKRDAKTGSLLGTGTMTAANGIHTFVNPVLYLGHSQYTSDKDALAAYDEVRLWRGVLTEAQLEASAAAGPDATITENAGGPSFVAGPTQEPPTQRPSLGDGGFRLMTYNVQFCYDENNTIVPDRTAARILAENPDFCCVNEVRDSEAHPEASVLAKVTGMHKTFGGNTSGSNGNLILSREEPLGSETLFLEMSKSGYGDRYCLICEFTNFCVAVTHLDTTTIASEDAVVQASNAVAIATIRAAFAKYTKPMFLCGDWNTRPNMENMGRFNEFLEILSPTNGVRTYQNHGSSSRILDYISVDKEHKDDFYVQRSYVVEDLVTSDHNPVIAELYRYPTISELGWVDERMITTGRTGTWTGSVEYNGETMKAVLGGEYLFTPNGSSGGTPVTMSVTTSFDAIPDEQETPKTGAQGAIWLGTNGCFQVWTKVGNGEPGTGNGEQGTENGWVDVVADGVTPTTGVDYTFRFTFDYAAKTYGVEVQTGLTGFTRLRERNPVNPVDPVQNFPLATAGSAVSGVRFSGDGVFTSLTGEYVAVEGFSEEETVFLKDNAEVILDAAKAAWLNSCAGGKTSVESAASGLSAQEFSDAYLLNLDITDGGRSYTFEITDVDVGAENVTVAVTLTRSGNIAQSINGVLKFYGAATLEAFKSAALQPLSSETVSDDDFSDGNIATATYPKVIGSATNTFFKAKIEER